MIAQQPENNIDPVPQLRRELYDLYETEPCSARLALITALDERRISPSEAHVIWATMNVKEACTTIRENGYEPASP